MFITKEKSPILNRVAKMLNAELAGDGQWFIDGMIAQGDIAFSKQDGAYIARTTWKFLKENEIEVRLYRAKSSKTLAMFTAKHPNMIFINERRLKRSDEDMAGTWMHEGTHAADQFDKNGRWGHGSNSSKGKAKSAPYAAGSITKGHFKLKKIAKAA